MRWASFSWAAFTGSGSCLTGELHAFCLECLSCLSGSWAQCSCRAGLEWGGGFGIFRSSGRSGLIRSLPSCGGVFGRIWGPIFRSCRFRVECLAVVLAHSAQFSSQRDLCLACGLPCGACRWVCYAGMLVVGVRAAPSFPRLDCAGSCAECGSDGSRDGPPCSGLAGWRLRGLVLTVLGG